ncbi:MAG: hypothetical protein WC584_03195 [Candidatus Pacearchaeota archaeon]
MAERDSFVGNPNEGISKNSILQRKEYKLEEEKYFDVVRYLDGLSGVKKDVEEGNIVYSAISVDPNLKIRAITRGNIIINNFERTVKISPDIELTDDLENKLKEKILGV